jgi:hypothetical protein
MSLFNEECIYNNWVHSYEEDTENEKVYRLSTFEFPPSRGRDGFEIDENGKVIKSSVYYGKEKEDTK